MTNNQNSKLTNFSVAACASALVGMYTAPQVQAIGIEDMLSASFAQIDAAAGLSTQDLVDGMLNNMAQDGVIRIPLKKEQTGFLSQVYAEADHEHWHDMLSSNEQLLSQSGTYDLNDPTQLAQAISLGLLKDVQVREPLTNSQNLSYIGEIYIGSGTPQKVRAIFDTGSANPWILSKKGTESMKEHQERHPFDPTLSTTFKEPGMPDMPKDKHWVRISFGSGEIRGYFVNDQAMLGSPDCQKNQLVVPNWTFGMVMSHSVFNGKFDALIGMAYPQFAEKGVTPLFDALMQSNQLHKNVHSWYMSYNPEEESEILLGGWNNDRFEGQLQWYPVVKKLFWAIKLDDVLVNGVSTGFCNRPGANCTVCPDSGTSLATFPKTHYDAFQAQYGDIVSCAEGDELRFPDLTYVIGGTKYNMPSHHWVTRKIDPRDAKGGKCGNIIKPLGVNQVGLEEMHILGDVFMQLYYTVHDRDNDMVGFAPAVHTMPEVLVQFDTSGILASVKTVETMPMKTL